MSFDKDKLIDSSIILDILKLTMLIYNYNKHFIFNRHDNASEILKNINIDDLEMPELRKQIFKEICEDSPKGQLLHFYNNKNNDMQGGLTISHQYKRICIIFRGSTSNMDWLHNFRICKTCLIDNIYVHGGFYKQLNENNFCNNIINDINNLLFKYPDYDIYISGHSLGGGLASLLSYLLSRIINNNITLITFACPRVGNYNWYKSFNSKTNLRHYRFINNHDIVTTIPYFNYYHTGNTILFKNADYIFTKYYEYKDSFLNSIMKSNSVDDHNLDNYYYKVIMHDLNSFIDLSDIKNIKDLTNIV